MIEQRKTIVAIDFDGTIVENRFPQIGKLRPHAVELIKKLKQDDVIIILWTCRKGDNLKKALDFCTNLGIDFDAVNTNYSNLPFETSNKIYADYYVDDRGIGIDWKKNYEEISKHIKEPFIKA